MRVRFKKLMKERFLNRIGVDKENFEWSGIEKCGYNTAIPFLGEDFLKNEGADVC